MIIPEKVRILYKEYDIEHQKNLHELLHGLDEMYGIDLKEKQVEKLGNALYMLIKDNPKMFERGDVH